MGGLPAIAATESYRVRRWDAVILGGALPGLVAAIRLAKRGARILVLEEARALAGFQGVREPFLATGAGAEQPFGACLRALGIPLIDQRRFATRDVAVQVILPDARVDLGRGALSIDELTAWGLAKPERARALLRSLEEAAEAERLAMLSAPVVRRVWRRGRAARQTELTRAIAPDAGAAAIPRARGLPEAVSEASDALRVVFAALCRALALTGGAPPPPEARARLLGGLLGGGASLGGADGWLRGMLRRRIESLFGEFRSVSGPIRMVSVAHQPGLAIGDSDEIWAGRTLVLNAPRAALARALTEPVPDILLAPEPTHRRVYVHLRGARRALPESMGENVVFVRDPAAQLEDRNVIAIRSFPGGKPDAVDLLAWSAVPAAVTDLEAVANGIELALRELLPFSEAELAREPMIEPVWDTDALLSDPEPGAGWPASCDVRLSGRPSIFVLERAWLGGLGFEGDLLLGWRAGDAIADDLS